MRKKNSPDVIDIPEVDVPEPVIIERDDISSPVLRRLIKEVQDEKGQGPTAYNRIHNRHNRGR